VSRVQTSSPPIVREIENLVPVVTELPHALVVSGLEDAGAPAQRSLMGVLTSKSIALDAEAFSRENTPQGTTGLWQLASDFIMIYVCAVDEHERPEIQRGLVRRTYTSISFPVLIIKKRHQLDLFSFSVSVPSSRSSSGGPPGHSRSRSDIGGILTPVSTQSFSHLQTTDKELVISSSEMSYLRYLARDTSRRTAQPLDHQPSPTIRVEIQPRLGLYALDLLTQARHHPALDGALLTARTHRDVDTMLRAARVIHGDSVGGALIRAAAEQVRAVAARVVGSAEGGTGTLGGSWEDDDGAFLQANGTLRSDGEWTHVYGSPGKDGAPSLKSADYAASIAPSKESGLPSVETEEEVWDVIAHRLRVRASPEEQVLGSVMYTAVPRRGEESRERAWERPTVKQIITDILESKDVV
jgi:hypothetical protein